MPGRALMYNPVTDEVICKLFFIDKFDCRSKETANMGKLAWSYRHALLGPHLPALPDVIRMTKMDNPMAFFWLGDQQQQRYGCASMPAVSSMYSQRIDNE